MNGAYGILLLVLMNAEKAPDVKPKATQDRNTKQVVGPDWTKGLPEDSGAFAVELRRRMAIGPVTRVRANVLTFRPNALSSINRGGVGGIHVAGTTVKITSPEKYLELELVIHHSNTPGMDACWRIPGCAVEFDLSERYLEYKHAGLRNAGFLYERELKNLAFDPSGNPARRGPNSGGGSPGQR